VPQLQELTAQNAELQKTFARQIEMHNDEKDQLRYASRNPFRSLCLTGPTYSSLLVEKTRLLGVLQEEAEVLRRERDTTVQAAAGALEERAAAVSLRETLEQVRCDGGRHCVP
jgi:hypothetical protein